GDLFFGEAVVRLIVIERLDHVIAIAPCLERIGVLLEAGGISVANKIEPVPAPLFAVAGRREQRIDQSLPGGGRVVAQELANLLGGWRQPEEIERSASNQGQFAGSGSGLDSGSVQFAE